MYAGYIASKSLCYLRSPPYTNPAKPYRTPNAMRLHDACREPMTIHNVRSCSGPKRTRRKFRSVRLVLEMIVVSDDDPARAVALRSSFTNCKDSSTRNVILVRRGGGTSNKVKLGLSVSVFSSYLRPASVASASSMKVSYFGRRCLGQGTRPKSCGQESRKLKV